MQPQCRLLQVLVLVAAAAAGTSVGAIATTSDNRANPGWAQTAISQLERLLPIPARPSIPWGSRIKTFGDWQIVKGCSTRNAILKRDLTDTTIQPGKTCKQQVENGILHDPYTGDTIHFQRGPKTSSAVPIDHIVSLKDAWDTGADLWTRTRRVAFANDWNELLAVDRAENTDKSDQDASQWLPLNTLYQCAYVAEQIQIKLDYSLRVTTSEQATMKAVLSHCPDGSIRPRQE